MNILLKAAEQYIKNGVCVIATNKDKRAFLSWKQYQDNIITLAQIREQLSNPASEAIAIVCGKSSGNLEVIDIDTKYDVTGKLYNDYISMIPEELKNKLLIVQTRSGGYHLYYRSEKIDGNRKLASRETTEAERLINPLEKMKVLIETRGQAGYVVAPPSKGYKIISGKDIPTISMEDRDLLLESACSFNQVIEKPQHVPATKGYNPKEFGLSPFDDYNLRGDLIGLLEKHGWTIVKQNSERIFLRRPGKQYGTSGDFQFQNKWFSVFSTSTEFDTNKAYLPYAVYCKLECNDDFKEAAKKLLFSGYGEKREHYGDKMERDLYKKKRDGMSKEQLIEYLVSQYKKQDKDATETIDRLDKIWGEILCTFWDVGDDSKLSINFSKLIDFLYATGGFSLYYYDERSTIFRIVRQFDGFIEEVSTEHIKKFLKSYIEGLPDTFDGGITQEDLKELILRGSGAYFSTGLLEFLNRSKFDFLKDTESECFIPFKNGVVKITSDGMSLVSYQSINKVIWRSQVVDADILIETDPDYTLCEYFKFIQCICAQDQERVEYAITLIGYMLHQYKDPTKPYAIILAEETENENKGGGTGKGIFVKALTHLVNVERIDGKNFKLDKSFAFQRVGLDTNLISIEDCKKNVDFEGFYSIITEGITVEKKNKDELFIPYEDSPKIVFTTNYSVPGIGNHGKRRQRVFEFSNFFTPTKTPEDYFGHKLFNDWDKDEWNRFYNLMFYCMQCYLQEGVKILRTSDNIKRKQIRNTFSEEFMEWFNNGFLDGDNQGTWWSISELYADFLRINDLHSKDYSIHRFKKGVKVTCDIFDLSLMEKRNKALDNRKEIMIGGKNWAKTPYQGNGNIIIE